MELLQSIDLDKVLGSMGQKEKQLEQLKAETRDGAEVIAQIYRSKNKEVERTREYARNESKVKDTAMHKMD
jgi:serine/threonine-protein kinase RIO1